MKRRQFYRLVGRHAGRRYHLYQLLKRFWLRLQEDEVFMVSGHLTYVSLLSLVPLMTVMLAMLSAFPVFVRIQEDIEAFLFDNFMPAAGEVIQDYLHQFVANTGQMTAFGILFLVVTALLLIHSIDTALNRIWRSKRDRRLVISFAVYWMVLTLGPLLAGTSLAISSWLLTLAEQTVSGARGFLLGWLPILASWTIFSLIYLVVPTTIVRMRHALIGGAVAALLFELSKRGFAIYLTEFPSYQMIYGALATVPILFVWIYLSWCIVLLGAELAAALGEHEQENKAKAADRPAVERPDTAPDR